MWYNRCIISSGFFCIIQIFPPIISSHKFLTDRRSSMQITDIKIRKIFTEGKLRAILSITVDNLIAIHDIKVVQGDDRLFVAMPSRRDENGIFRDVVHPISAEGRIFIENEVLKAYNEYLMVNEIENSTQDFSSLPS